MEDKADCLCCYIGLYSNNWWIDIPPETSNFPNAAFSVNDWTAFVIFIVVIGGIGTLEGPIIGTLIFFMLRETLADFGTIYLMILGAVGIVVMLKAPKGVWGLIRERFDLELFPLSYRVRQNKNDKELS